ncbi:peptide chain release factor N(5)-glutamine methyltransferase [Aquincola tertiaricarbonis]|uniref:Release factor glutamine methyltransferase n=1 Tax=Aquincola tertiaricarbonis TaxID=391953 RepID=A0ABY4SBA5_AQUTE|nr:peptide chain release factor N(5)-glutamine methyltransferase [Aquincola tertiaricarbonis]URI09450.1 peptide chain release factor N(5)-glutamine methyltransferase [Aquincola tertiaricarbonis]
MAEPATPRITPPAARTVAQALADARALGLDRLDAQLLLAHRLGQPRTWLLTHDTDLLPAAVDAAFSADCRARADAVPLAYLTGQHEFHGLMLQVTPDVLDPRPDTETLVTWALDCLAVRPAMLPAPRVIDLGTGSGAIALAVQHAWPAAEVHALDASAAALEVARANGRRLALPVQWHAGNWWQGAPEGRFDLVLSNPPYIAGDDPHLPALRHEPRMALTPEGDGLDAIRTIVAGAPTRLQPGGWLLLEHGYDQAAQVATLLAAAGFHDIAHRHDLAGHARCTGGRHLG